MSKIILHLLQLFLQQTRFSLWLGKRSPRISAFFTLVLVILLAIDCSWKKPLVRSFMYVALFLLAKIFELRASKWWILLWSLLLSFFWGEGGFLSSLLTSSAVLSFHFAYEILEQKNYNKRKMLSSLAPYFCTLPLILYFFASFSPLSPLQNFLLCPLLSLGILLPGFASILEGKILATHLFEQFANYNASHLLALLRLYEERGNFFYWVPWKQYALACLVFLPLIFLWDYSKRYTLFLGAMLSGVFILHPTHFLGAAILDVHQGDSIFLVSKNSLLVDAGPSSRSNYPSRSSQALEKMGIDSVDDVLLTHPDADHYGWLSSVFLRHSVHGALWLHPEILQYPKVEKVLALAETAQVPVLFFRPNDFNLDELECHWQPYTKNVNALSPLCRTILPSGKTLLLTGDMDSDSEHYYGQTFPKFLVADFVKLAHHGSKTSSSERFLLATGAKNAVISVGEKNRYHHPSPEVLERLDKLGIKAESTAHSGTILIE